MLLRVARRVRRGSVCERSHWLVDLRARPVGSVADLCYFTMRDIWAARSGKRVVVSTAAAEKVVAVERADDGIDGVEVKHPRPGARIVMVAFLKESYIDALLVIHGDQIVHEKKFNGTDLNAFDTIVSYLRGN